MQGKKHYEEKLFTQVHLSRRIPRDNYYRRLKRKLNLNYIYKLTEKYYGKRGKQSIDPVVFFKLCFIKKKEGVTSDKKLIDFCNIRLDIIYFLDYNIDEKLPHYNTIYRTRKLFPDDLYNSIMEKIEEKAVEQEKK